MALPIQFRDLCRACMKRREDMRMFFFSRINSVEIASMLTKIALLPVEPSDSLPKVLCSVCIRKLNDAYNFQQMCIKSHITFNDMLQNKQKYSEANFIKKEPCEFTISSVQSQADGCGENSLPQNVPSHTGAAAPQAEAAGMFHEPKVEPHSDDNSLEEEERIKYDRNHGIKPRIKKYACNFCRDVFDNWNDFNGHVATHRGRNHAAVNDENYAVQGKRRRVSETSTSTGVFPVELGFRLDNNNFDCRSDNNSIDGLPLEPICSVQIKEEIQSDHSISEYEEEQDGSVKYDKYNKEEEEDGGGEDYQMTNNIESSKQGRNFVNSKSPVCEMCGFKPKIPALMHAHVRNRHPENYMEYVENLKSSGDFVVKCRICDVYLFSSTIYGQHLKYTHSQIVNDCSGYFECNLCDQTFNTKNDFFLHKNQAHNMRRINKAKQIFTCLLCDKQFGRYSNLQQHEETHDCNGAAVNNGNISGSGTSTRSYGSGDGGMSGMLRRKRIEPPIEPPIPTPNAAAIVKAPPKKVSNVTNPAGVRFPCRACEKSFGSEFGLRVHIGCVHKGMDKLPPKGSRVSSTATNVPKPAPPPVTDTYCEICEKQFDSVTECGSHMQKHYEVAYTYRERTIRCKECKHESTSRSEFKHHIKMRHKELYRKRIAGLATMDPRFEACNLCFTPVFCTKIIRHINSHYMRENERRDESDDMIGSSPQTVSKVGKNSPKEQCLLTQQHQNGKALKHKCKTCSKFYPDKSSLMKHMLTFHKKPDGRKHFTCKICFRCITGLQNYNSHMNSHKGEYPKTKSKNHACHMCSGVFGEREDLQKHLIVAHSFNPMIFYKK